MRYFMIVMGLIVTLTFLLAILAGPAQAGGAAAASVAPDAELVDGTPLICLALVSGTALLAGIAWLGALQRVNQPVPDASANNSRMRSTASGTGAAIAGEGPSPKS